MKHVAMTEKIFSVHTKHSEIELTEVPVEKLEECAGFSYRWLKNKCKSDSDVFIIKT